jgi:hypothetical protein
MKKSAVDMAFFLVLAVAALFVIRSGGTMPDVVATHFGPSGAANGFMSRSFW